jgi:hypothetical protein
MASKIGLTKSIGGLAKPAGLSKAIAGSADAITTEYCQGLQDFLCTHLDIKRDKLLQVWNEYDKSFKYATITGQTSSVSILVNYTATTHAILGVTPPVRDILNALNRQENRKVVTPRQLATKYGEGWIILAHDDLDLVIDALTKSNVAYDRTTRATFDKTNGDSGDVPKKSAAKKKPDAPKKAPAKKVQIKEPKKIKLDKTNK